MLSLEKIFIEKRIYNQIEDCETWEAVLSTIDKGLKPYTKHLKEPVTEEDCARLTEIKIKRISRYRLEERGRRSEEDRGADRGDAGLPREPDRATRSRGSRT